ncbi:MAG: helix-turn-helix domain-containing protein [Opitutaceae bacterium]|nr:helix-turn-helix domain-containing protein [Opitutaceae bacterium]
MPALTSPRFAPPPVLPSPDDQELARKSSRTLLGLLQQARSGLPQLTFPVRGQRAAETVPLPAAAAPLIAQILSQLARGNAVTVIPIHSELTTQQAADLLGVSRPHLVGLLQEKKVPFRKVGSHRRVRFSDLMAFKSAEDAARQKALDALAAQAQELKLGY